MTRSVTQEEIDEQAATWAARNMRDDMADADAFEAWLAADRRHRGAYLRAQACYYVLEASALASPIPPVSNDDDHEPVQPPVRRRLWPIASGLAVAACAAITIVVGVPDLESGRAERSTQAMTLADGSSVALGQDGAIVSAMAGPMRIVTLRQGSATFNVAKDPGRPFIVRAGLIYAEATGTVYSVRRVGAEGGAVSVAEGSVRVWAEGARDKAVMLHAGGALTLDPAHMAAPQTEITQFWFDNTTIRDAADRFNRQGGKRIDVPDAGIGQVTITGGFRSDQPEQFARAAATIAGARMTERAGALVIEEK